MDMDKRIHLELRNRTPSDVSICQKYLCRSILLLCVMCACVFGGEGTFLWRGATGRCRVWGRTANELQGWMGGVAMLSEHVPATAAAALGV